MEKKVNVSETLLSQLYDKRGKKDKETFLRDYLRDNEVRESYTVYLAQAGEYERLLGRELYEFNEREVKGMFANNFTSSPASLRILFSVCKQYVDWATDRHLNTTGLNVFNTLNFKKHILPMINSKALAKEIITEEQLWEIINLVRPYKNAQDLVCVILPFYGIKGIKNTLAINLLKMDIDDENNLIGIRNEKCDEIIRTVQLPKVAMNLLIQAAGEREYIKVGKGKKENSPMQLVDSPFIIRPVENGKNLSFSHMISSGIASRAKKSLIKAKEEFDKIKKDLEDGKIVDENTKKEYERIVGILKDVVIDKLSINNIYNSGKIHVLKEMEVAKGEALDFNDYKKVNELFGEKTVNDKIMNYDNIKTLFEVYTGKK